MSEAVKTAQIACTSVPLSHIDTDVLIVPWFEGGVISAVPGLDDAIGGELQRAVASKEFEGRLYEFMLNAVADRSWVSRRVALVGAGHLADFTGELARKIATSSGLAMKQRRVDRAAFVLPQGVPVRLETEFAQAVIEGLTLSEFNAGSYKTGDIPPGKPPVWTIVTTGVPAEREPAVIAAVQRGRLLGECSNLAREMANEPSNTLTPREFARRAEALVAGCGLSFEVLDEKRIEELGMGMLLGVARGSNEPPRLMVLRHNPPGAPATPVLGLVGKGITFDTGGISIKPADGMERMKDDMAGGSAVVCAMRAIAMLNAPVRVIGIVPTTENMPGGRAIKPGDVLKSAEGKTVEVINTDAEGRLILGDGLWYARHAHRRHRDSARQTDVRTFRNTSAMGGSCSPCRRPRRRSHVAHAAL
jgi:leucyl aminopeptidase